MVFRMGVKRTIIFVIFFSLVYVLILFGADPKYFRQGIYTIASSNVGSNLALEPTTEQRNTDFYDTRANVETDTNLDAVVDKLIEKLQHENFFPDNFYNLSMKELTRYLRRKDLHDAQKLPNYTNINTTVPHSAWRLVCSNIRQYTVYDPDDANVDILMTNMATLPIKRLKIIKGGTQLNLRVVLQDETVAVMKSMRLPRDREELPNVYYFDFLERHTAEIASFQLDKILGFYRVPPTIGRKVNIVSEMKPVASGEFKKTVFKSAANNTCFTGKCSRWCDVAHAYCGNPDIIEVSMMMFVPSELNTVRLPWKRSWSHTRKAAWEKKDNYCTHVRGLPLYHEDKMLAEAIDAYIFDFMTGNEDRHVFYYIEAFRNDTYSVLTDNGKGFGRYYIDTMTNLKPLSQCCIVRKSTFLTFLKLYTGSEKLSVLMAEALSRDPVAPILTDGHLQALDRRVPKVLRAITDCIFKHGIDKVVIDI